MADQRSAERADQTHRILTMVRWLLTMLFVVIGYLVLHALGPVLAPILAAGGVAYLLDGAVDRLEARGIRRVVAVTGMLILFVGTVVIALVVLIPLASTEIAHFIDSLPRILDSAGAWLEANLGWHVPDDWVAYFEGPKFQEMLSKAAGPLAAISAAVVGGLFSVLGFLAEMLLVPVFAFYLLVDWDGIVARVRLFIPPRHRTAVGEVMTDIDSAVSIWIRGQLIVMAILAVLYAAAFKIIGIQLGVTIGIVVGLLTIIPFVGTIVGAAITVLVVLLDWQGPADLISVACVFVVLHLLEAAILTPKLVGKKVGLGELGALFAVVAGGKLLGFTGVLLAVPIAASVAVLVRRAVRYYEGSRFFTTGAELAPEPLGPEPPPSPIRDDILSDFGVPPVEPDSDTDLLPADEPPTVIAPPPLPRGDDE